MDPLIHSSIDAKFYDDACQLAQELADRSNMPCCVAIIPSENRAVCVFPNKPPDQRLPLDWTEVQMFAPRTGL